MKSKKSPFVATLLTIGLFTGAANATLLLSIDEFSSTAITVTIHGTLDESTAASPADPGLFFIAPSTDLTTQWYTGDLVLESGDFLVNGGDFFGPSGVDNGSNTGDSIAFLGASTRGTVVAAGTTITGTVRFTGNIDAVNFSAGDFNLYSGLTAPQNAFKLEASAVPEPSSVSLVGLGIMSLVLRRKRA